MGIEMNSGWRNDQDQVQPSMASAWSSTISSQVIQQFKELFKSLL